MDYWLVVYFILSVHFILSFYYAYYIYRYYYRDTPMLVINILFGSIGFIKSLIMSIKKERPSFY